MTGEWTHVGGVVGREDRLSGGHYAGSGWLVVRGRGAGVAHR